MGEIEDKLKNFKCPCRECKNFFDVEGIGWVYIFNGHAVNCEDGKTRHVDLENGCGDFTPISTTGIYVPTVSGMVE